MEELQNALCPLVPKESDFLDEPADCVFCWKFNETIPRQKIELKNPKYCWLYPRHERKELKKILPKFDHCPTLYTSCDYQLEMCVHEIILRLEERFKAFYDQLNDQLQKQIQLVDEMWVQSQRFLLLTQGSVCIKTYPEIISAVTERRALCSFYINLKVVKDSNSLLSHSLSEIRELFGELKRRIGLLDMTVDSPFLKGAWYQQSLPDVQTLLEDLFQCFYQQLCKIKCWAELLDPGDQPAIEDYLSLIKSLHQHENNLFDYFNQCHCLRTNRKNCFKQRDNC